MNFMFQYQQQQQQQQHQQHPMMANLASQSNSNNNMAETPSQSKTLYVGNLSIYCTAEELQRLFGVFGPIESIHLKKTNQGVASYCFVKFFQRRMAEDALLHMNGVDVHGRPLKIGWAVEYEGGVPTQPVPPFAQSRLARKASAEPTAQLHVTFSSRSAVPLQELFFRTLFARYGEVLDVAIKKIQFNPETGEQSGYSFVHFPLTREGISSALSAVHAMNGTLVDGVSIYCRVSHGLADHINALSSLNLRL